MSFAGEPSRVRLSGGPISFYEEYTTTNAYVERVFGGGCYEISVTNDSTTDPVQLSWDGATLEADVKAGESVTLKAVDKSSIRVKATTGGEKVRIWAW